MIIFNKELGSARDNLRSPVHNWYKFTAGFSYQFVDEIIAKEKLIKNVSAVYEPFAGCGTTLVQSQKSGIYAYGNEGQEFMYNIINAKLSWNIDEIAFRNGLDKIKTEALSTNNISDSIIHDLLKTLYKHDDLLQIYKIRETINTFTDRASYLFFYLALSQTLHKVSIHPIASPYISRNKILTNTTSAITIFEKIAKSMFEDTRDIVDCPKTSNVFFHDSRFENPNIKSESCDTCITSPPYLNNLDYGEVSKVHTHFFNITNSWNDITKNVRQNLVTAATTHYKDAEFDIDKFKESEFYNINENICNELILTASSIKEIAKLRNGKKSFGILALYYFNDMYSVLKEIKRILKPDSRAYLILGDSAPYGFFIPTTEYLGEIAKNLGFKSYEIHKIRTRGTKWSTLKNRHHLELSENVLILSK
jgi:DNA modification methylase